MKIDLTPYKRPALAFSGGKDSLALLYMLRDQLDRVQVYWCNAGDGMASTLALIAKVREWIPHFTEIKTDVISWRRVHGMPSDLVPDSGTMVGVASGLGSVRVVSKFECCAHNLFLPTHQRMVEDGVDCVIRGTKLVDTGKIPAEGLTPWYTILLPLRDWSHEQVFAYLDSVGAPKNALYEHAGKISAPECFGCTGWWGDGKAEYFRAKHPDKLAVYKDRLRMLRGLIAADLAALDKELEA